VRRLLPVLENDAKGDFAMHQHTLYGALSFTILGGLGLLLLLRLVLLIVLLAA
jgi:hypothetical protein